MMLLPLPLLSEQKHRALDPYGSIIAESSLIDKSIIYVDKTGSRITSSVNRRISARHARDDVGISCQLFHLYADKAYCLAVRVFPVVEKWQQ